MFSLASTKRGLAGVAVAAMLSFGGIQNASADAIPMASDWSTSVTTVINRGGSYSTSVTDIAGGVRLHFESTSGGSGVGTTTRRYDFTTTAAASGGNVTLDLNVLYSAFLGFFQEDVGLQITKNGSTLYDLIPNSFGGNPVSISQTFSNYTIALNTGDTWGISALAGNFTECCGASGNIDVTTVPEPESLALLGLGLMALAAARRRKQKLA